MTFNGWLQIIVFFLVDPRAHASRSASYMFRVFEGDKQPLPRTLGRIERGLLAAVRPRASRKEQTWVQYAIAMLVFSAIGLVVTYLIQRTQGSLPFNPQHLGGVPGAARVQHRRELHDEHELAVVRPRDDDELPHPDGRAGVAQLHVGRGRHRRRARRRARPDAAARPRRRKGVGNFYVDLIRGIVYVLLPICIVVALVLVSQGVIQNLAGYHAVTTLEGGKQMIAMGPVASQEAIKELGTNGGGFFNANSAHPFENPSALTNFLEMVLIFAIPAGLTYTYGRMARDQRQGWVLFAAMSVLFFAGVATAYWAESHPNAAMHDLARRGGAGQHGGQGDPVRHRRTRRCSRRSRPTRRAARSTRGTTASRRSAAWCRWSTSSSARSCSAASAPGSTGSWCSSCSRCSSPA